MTTLVLCRDLMFTSKISATAAAVGVPITLIRDATKLADAGEAKRMIVDLNQAGFLDAAADWKSRTGGKVVGFVGHTDTSTISRAQSAGLDEVLPRSAFVARLDEILTASV